MVVFSNVDNGIYQGCLVFFLAFINHLQCAKHFTNSSFDPHNSLGDSSYDYPHFIVEDAKPNRFSD